MKFLRISGDASSSSGANNSSLICGTFSCSECISNIDCLWCSSKSSCLNINEDDDSCNSQDVTLTCESNDYLLIVVVVISTISMISLCLLLWYWHYSGSRDNQNQTSINSRPTRDEVWKKDDSKPDWFCIICGGDNKLNASSCLLCGTSKDFTIEYKEQRRLWIKELISTNTGSQIADESEYEIQSLSKISLQQVADASLGITMEERLKAFNYRRINQLSLRQKSARRRKFWQRVLDKQSGRIEWVRVPTNQVKIGDGPLGYKSQESFFQPLLEPLIENDDVEWKDTLTSQLLAAHSVRSSSRLEGSALMSASPAYVHVIDADGQLRWQEVDDQRLSTSPGSDSMRIHEDLINVASYPFNEKQYWFVTRTAKLQKQPMEGLISIEVERSRVLEMSFIALMNAEPEDLHKYFRISFRGEPGLDAGGEFILQITVLSLLSYGLLFLFFWSYHQV